MTQYIDGIAEIPQSRCVVSEDFRTLTIPAKERTLGCVGDDETRRVWFDMPVENDGISLRGSALSIHYVNAAGNSNRYDVATAYVVDNRVLFAWLVQRGAYEAAGLVSVSIKMRSLDGENVLDEFNSATAPFTVKDSHNFDEQPQPEQTDWVGAFIAQQSARIDAKIALADEAIADAQDATTAANTAAASATSAAQGASQAATAANRAATEASQAATDATDAAERAEQAAEGVESAIDAATAAATSANSAAATATAAASNADSKAALANTAASTANQAAQAAESATTAANTAAGQATTAAGTANTAAQTATTAAGNADAKAALADTAAANADTATANANTATANANTAATAANNAAQAANNAAEYAIDAADDIPKLSTTASGTTAQTVNDAWPATPESAVLYGKSVQDGTPTPDNPVPVQVVEAPIGLQVGETVTPVDLQGHTLAGGDILRVNAAGRVWIERHAILYEFDSSKAWYAVSGVTDVFYQTNSGTDSNLIARLADYRGSMFCDYLPVAKTGYATGEYQSWISAYPANAQYPGQNWVYLRLEGATSASDIQSFIARVGLKAYMPLATPQTIELGTIELPELTNPCELAIYASLDPEWAIQYEQDPNAVITSLQASIAPVEGSTASANYAVNSYLIHDNQLYRVTSAIATGEAITPGSNCVACTVMGELVRLTA